MSLWDSFCLFFFPVKQYNLKCKYEIKNKLRLIKKTKQNNQNVDNFLSDFSIGTSVTVWYENFDSSQLSVGRLLKIVMEINRMIK